jgi:hypothetical protein
MSTTLEGNDDWELRLLLNNVQEWLASPPDDMGAVFYVGVAASIAGVQLECSPRAAMNFLRADLDDDLRFEDRERLNTLIRSLSPRGDAP